MKTSIREEMEANIARMAGVPPEKAEVIAYRVLEIMLRASGDPKYQSTIWKLLTGE